MDPALFGLQASFSNAKNTYPAFKGKSTDITISSRGFSEILFDTDRDFEVVLSNPLCVRH